MDILLLLAAERSRIVSREEIADQVWGRGVCLDVDNSINGAIRKIRQALKDDPEQPRYIQTVTGRGYRFIAAVVADAPTHVEPAVSVENPPVEAAADSAPSVTPPTNVAVTEVQPIVHPQPEVAAPSVRSWWPVMVLIAFTLMVVAGWLWWRHVAQQREVVHAKVRLAVLPFQNLTGDPSQDYYSDGFTEEMITQLGSLDPQHLAVIARTSVMSYKDGRAPLDRIARELGVQYVLEGSVRRDVNDVRVTAQLIQVREQTTVWSKEYDHDPKDLLVVQSEIAREIAKGIQLALGGKSTTTKPRLSAQEYEAHDLYLRGRYLWSKRTGKDLDGAVSWFQQAIARDPNYAPAYAGLADTYTIMSAYGYVPANTYMPMARSAALKAVQLDDSLAEAHTSLALIAQNYDWDWKTAEKEYRRAIELNPNYATAHHWLAECLAYQARFDEALAESERAQELDPLSLIIAADNGAIYYFARQYDRAIARFRGVLDLDPSFSRAHLILNAYVEQGRFQEALAALDEWRRLDDGPWKHAAEAYVYGRMGDKAKAQHAFEQMEQDSRSLTVEPTELYDTAYAGIGDKDKWLAWLQRSYRDHTSLPTRLKVDPLYDPLRSDPRFQQLLRNVDLDH
jgi:TolB-like protein/DNA-binding winged helix-turn-helix (wHTH) protein/Flp pilus assembly protein TadD